MVATAFYSAHSKQLYGKPDFINNVYAELGGKSSKVTLQKSMVGTNQLLQDMPVIYLWTKGSKRGPDSPGIWGPPTSQERGVLPVSAAWEPSLQ